MLGEWLKGRLDELKEGLRELQEQADAQGHGLAQAGLRQTAPVYYSADTEPELPPDLAVQDQPEVPNIDRAVREPAPPMPAKSSDVLRERLRDPRRLREAIVVREILDKPVALRGPGRRAFHDR